MDGEGAGTIDGTTIGVIMAAPTATIADTVTIGATVTIEQTVAIGATIAIEATVAIGPTVAIGTTAVTIRDPDAATIGAAAADTATAAITATGTELPPPQSDPPGPCPGGPGRFLPTSLPPPRFE